MNKKIKIILSVFISTILVSSVFGIDGARTCKTIYTEINGAKYFSSFHCTEDIKISGVVRDSYIVMRDISTRVMSDFIIANYGEITNHIDSGSGNTCDNLDSVDAIQSFENTIYSKNDLSYTSTTSSIESLTTDIEQLEKDYNSSDLYNTVFNEVKTKYSSASISFLRIEAQDKYFERQLTIKNDILSKQKEKLNLLYKLKESQVFIEKFYNQIGRVCEGYYNKKMEEYNGEDEDFETMSDDEKQDEKQEKIEKYKIEFNEKLGDKLDEMSRQVLQKLSIKLLDYADSSPLFNRFSQSQREIIKLKITALKQAIDDRLD